MTTTPTTSNSKTAPDPGMTAFDLARLDINDTLYVKRIETAEGAGFEVHAADGTPLFVVDDMRDVVAAARKNDMRLATLH